MTRRSGFLASMLAAAAMIIAPMSPALALPMVSRTAATFQSAGDVTKVHDRRVRHRHLRRHFRRDDGRVYLNGHRGYRHHRRGWREYNGWWFPPAAFALGLAFGNNRRYVDPPRRYRDFPRAHYRWCDRKYRSYRHWDNTYQPYHGPRRQCWSPYN